MKTLIKGLKRLIAPTVRLAAFAIATLGVTSAWAATDYTGTDYEPWSYSAGCVVWRAASGQLFHASTVADVAADGTVGETYDLNTSGHPWQVFASNQSQYTSPGKVLVFDVAGYNNNSDAQFAPMSFGGMWVKALHAEDTPYCITDTTSSSARQVELGATGASTYFKFDESFTFDRNSATTVKGTATVEIAEDATFTINARAGKGAVVESGNTLVLKGEGTLAVVGGLTISGTLDLSETTRPTINGDVALAGTIVLPEGTVVSQESPFTVCSGTLSGVNVFVKIGDAEAVEKSFTAENGAITSFGDPIYIFTENYPTVVPAGVTYTFVGGDSAENTVVVDALDVKGTLKTQGYFSFTNYKSNGSTLDVESGSLTLNPGNNWFNGTLTVEAGATFVNTLASDAVQYGGSFTANIYGTLAMGDTRWSLGSNNTINLYEGCTVTGTGSNSGYSALDWIENATATLNVYGDVTLEAPIRIRGTATVNVNVDSGDQAGLTLAGTAGVGKIVKKGAGLVKFTTNPSYAITVENGAFTFAVDATPTITYSAKPGAGTTMSMWYATQATWKGTVVLGVLSAPASLPLDSYGNENSKIVLKGTTGNCYLDGTRTVTAEVVIDTDEDHVVEFNNGNSGQIGTFSKISGAGTLKLTAWSNSSGVTYNINTFDGFTGTLAINNTITRAAGGTMTIGIGNIVTTDSTEPGACVLPIVNTAVENTTGTVVYNIANAQVNGEAADLEVKEDGIYIVVPVTMVTVTIPDVANTTVTVTADGEPVVGENGSYEVPEGSEVVATYAAAAGYEMTGTASYTIASATEGASVTPSITTKQYVAYVVFQVEQGESFVDVTNYYTTVAAAIDAAKALKRTIVLIAQPDAEDTYEIAVGETINVKKGEFTFDGIIFPEGPQYNNTTSVIGNVTQYKCATYTVTVKYPEQDPVGMTGQLIQILGGLYQNYLPVYAGTVVTVLDGSDGTVADAMPDVFTYNSEAHTYTLKTMVASYYNGYTTTYYPTLAYAVANVPTDGTIVLLTNLTLDARVEPSKSMTIDLNGKTITPTATCGNGSAFDVKSGTVTIKNGTIDGSAITTIECDPITARSGANVTLEGLTITINSQTGACVYPFAGAQVTILSGTYANATQADYQYHAGWRGMAVNQVNKKDDGGVLTQRITIYGGSFKQVNPALGDDSWADGEGTFLASGYASTWNPSTGYYDVAEVQEVPVTPGAQTEPVDTQEAAETEAAKVVPSVPAAVAEKLTDEQKADYTEMFEAKVVQVTVGEATKYAVEVVMKESAAEVIQAQVDAKTGDFAEAAAKAAADAVNGGSANVSTVAGLYYVVEAGSEVDGIAPASCTLATGSTLVLTLPNKGTSGFYKLRVSVTPVAVPSND